MAFCDLKT